LLDVKTASKEGEGTTLAKRRLMSLLAIQGLVCILIAFWGATMLVVGVIGGNPTWMGLGLAVLIIGLPFARNALRSDGSSDKGLLS
jgi:hypothetical protein